MVLETKDDFASVPIMFFHEHRALQDQLFDDQNGAMDPVDVVGLQAQKCFIVYPCKP